MANSAMRSEVMTHLTKDIIPFWKSLRDDENGGYTGYLGYDLKADKKAVKRLHLKQPHHMVLCQRIHASWR